MNRVQWWLAIAVAATMVACGGGGGSTTDDGTPDNGPTDPGGPIDPGGDEGRPDGVEPDNGTDPGAQCTCDTVDACCDGCRPINEDGACGQGGQCLVQGTCQDGACVGAGPLVCDDQGPCQEPGTCDPATGLCEYADRPDQSPCVAVEDIDGSGLCLAGVCYGFGRCDHRTYDQPTGSACNFDAECAEGWCQPLGDDWSAFCTRRCGVGLAACPEDMACVTDGTGTTDMHCRPLNKDLTLPGDASVELYRACNRNEDCAGGLCLSSDGKRFCTGSCEKDGAADEAACGTCGECRDNGDELGFDFKFYCMPEGSNAIGEPCGMSSDCKIAFCQGGLCSGQCFTLGEGLSSCPGDMQCVTGLFEDPALFVCVPAEQANRDLGETCEGDWSCTEGTCEEYAGAMACMVECAEETPCADGWTCLEVGYANLCVANDRVGVIAQGEACDYGFECVEGAVCYAGACLVPCETDEDCARGACFLDAMFQAMYCAPPCGDDDACPERMECLGEACVMSAGGDTYLFGACRSDRDCETGHCVDGTCTVACADEAPCEGAIAPAWASQKLCQPCNPWNFGADCNEGGGWGFNECVQTGDTTGFCAPECGFRGPGICPVGTRCYNIDGYTQACVPVSGSCDITSACGNAGTCVRPVAEGMPCSEDVQCAGGKCTDGLCLSAACVEDADCGCELLECGDGTCALDPTATQEAEPNDDLDDAQALPAGMTRVVASLMPAGARADIDLFKVHLDAGQALDVITSPFCGQSADTYLRLVASDGTPLPGWENDDIDPNGWYFSWLNGFVAEAAMDVYVEVGQSPYVAGYARFNYVLEVNAFTVQANDTCAGAQALVAGTEVHDLATAIDTYQVGSCTGGYPAPGKDVAFALTVPAMTSVEITIDAPFDAQLMLIEDCESADATCLTGADDVWDPGVETLLWANPTGMPVTLFLVVDSFYMGGDAQFELTVAFAPAEPPDWDLVDGSVEIALDTPVPLTLLGANNDYDAEGWGCALAGATPGPDIVLYSTFAANEFGVFQVQDLVGKMPNLYLTTDPGGSEPPECLASGRGVVQWQAGDAPVQVYLVIDEAGPHDYARFNLLARRGPVADCFGPCDPSSWEWACIGDTAGLCLCDEATRALAPFDCDDYCVGDGALSGTCHTFTTPGYERDSCMCDYDCAVPNTQCEDGYYTNCTCGAADPCGWQGDDYCNDFCEIEYPDDFFDDTADCTPAT
jgi:hypothetical protein